MTPKDPPEQGEPQPQTDAWGLPVLPPPSPPAADDELGICLGDEDEW